MGQKVNPNGFRYGISKKHIAHWMPKDKQEMANNLIEDQKIYRFFQKITRLYMIGKVEIFRYPKKVTLFVHSAKPGAFIGQGGENLKTLSKNLSLFVKNRKLNFQIEVQEISSPETDATLIAQQIAQKIENRQSFRAAQKVAIRFAMKNGAKGIKTLVSGRLNGVDMARSEGYKEGEMKLQTLRQNLDYGVATAKTTYGAIGVKVWVSHGEFLVKKNPKINRKNFNFESKLSENAKEVFQERKSEV